MLFSSASKRAKDTRENLFFAVDNAMNDASLKGWSTTLFCHDGVAAESVEEIIEALEAAGYKVQVSTILDNTFRISWPDPN